ncbi:hypothetical protein V6N13_073852 [Hibiscus sabdariffa]
MRVLSWNVRGLGAVSKRRAIQVLLRKHEVEMVLFQETKLVYAPCVRSERHDLWERLLAVTSVVEIPCCLGGDFNEVTNNAEPRGCVGDRGGHIKVMGDEWQRISDSHTTSSVVDRLRELKVFLKQWNRESFGCIKTQIETTTALLNDLDD